jgi:predicted outer membrane repeat protein
MGRSMMRISLAAALGLILALLGLRLLGSGMPAALAGGPWYVDPAGNDENTCLAPGAETACKTIAGAIGKATAGDTVNIITGTYFENLVVTRSLTFIGAGQDSTIVDGNNADRVLHITSGDVSISNLTIQRGKTTGSGGGIYASGGLTLSNVIVISNTSVADGGGAYVGGTAGVSGSLFQNNRSTGSNYWAGGLYVQSSLILTGVQFISNTADGRGGGALAYGPATVWGGVFQDNQSGENGGGLFANGVLTLTGTQFLSNTAGGSGGGVCAYDAATLSGGVFQNNQSSSGGGVWGLGLTLTGTQFISNTSVGSGGGANVSGAALSGGLFQNNRCTGSTCKGGGLAAGNLTLNGAQLISNTSVGNGGGISAGGAAVVSDGLFRNNQCTGSGCRGGGVWVNGATVLSGGLFQNNRCTGHACLGGGLNGESTLNVTDTRFISNTSASNGGGARAGGAATLVGGLFQDNQCTESGCEGGGLVTPNTLALSGTRFVGNASVSSGGGARASGSAMLSGGLFQNNRCTASTCKGGGLNAAGGLTLTGTQFIANAAGGWGGGLRHGSGSARLVNALFARNSASANGAAAALDSAGNVLILHTTIASPTLSSGAALYVTTGTVGITDTIVASCTRGIEQAGGTVYQDYNLLFYAPVSGTVGGGSHNPGGSPAFSNPANDDYDLTAGSAAVNKGVNVGVWTDIHGDPRPDCARVDIGADEYQGLPCRRIYLPVVLRQ